MATKMDTIKLRRLKALLMCVNLGSSSFTSTARPLSLCQSFSFYPHRDSCSCYWGMKLPPQPQNLPHVSSVMLQSYSLTQILAPRTTTGDRGHWQLQSSGYHRRSSVQLGIYMTSWINRSQIDIRQQGVSSVVMPVHLKLIQAAEQSYNVSLVWAEPNKTLWPLWNLLCVWK